MCMKEPVFDLIIGNVPGARKPNDLNPEWGVVAAAVTRAQARERGKSKPLKVKKVTSRMAVDKEELVRLQEEDSTLQKFKETKETVTIKGYRISYKKRGRIWYRVRQRKDEVEYTRKQILMPKLLRAKVMEVAYESLFGGHLGVKKRRTGSRQISFGQDYTMKLPVFADRAVFVRKLCVENRYHGLHWEICN